MIILTGGAGFIGSCFLWKLNRESVEDIIIVDDLGETEKWQNLTGKRFIDYIQKDDFLRMVEANKAPVPDAVIHMGACSSTTLTDADYYIRNTREMGSCKKSLISLCFIRRHLRLRRERL